MFIGRKRELEALRDELARERKSSILLYGRRRVGKTELVKEAIKNISDTVIVYHEFHAVTLEQNLKEFTSSIALSFALPSLPPFTSIESAFSFINAMNQRTIIILDEYSDFKLSTSKGIVDSYMRSVMDALSSKCNIIIMGSMLKLMKELLEEDNPLFGRFTAILKLQPMNYLEASAFMPRLSQYEQLQHYSIFGGSPYVLSLLYPDATIKENITHNLIPLSSAVRAYAEAVIAMEAGRVPHALTILSNIGNGKRTYSELENALRSEASGVLNNTLKKLIELDIIEKTQPVNKKGKSCLFYEIKDSLLHFYFTYIYPNPSLLMSNPDTFYENFIAKSIKDFIAKRFETCCHEYFALLIEKGLRSDIKRIGTYWYDDKEARTNGEFDVALETLAGYEIYDAKFHQAPVSEKEAEIERGQIARLALNVNKWGMISTSGFAAVDSSYEQITLSDLFDPALE